MADDRRFVFTKIVVEDLDAQSIFYATALGQVVKHRLSGGDGVAAFDEIVMGSPDGDGPALLLLRHLHRDTPQPGEAVLGFAVADVDRAVRAAVGAGGVVRSEPRDVPRSGIRVAELADPEGHLVEIIQHR